jgi:hypothetical protein
MRRWLPCLAVFFSIAGCYESPDVTLHEAHEYKGKTDNHVGDASYRWDLLRVRFKTVQTDR